MDALDSKALDTKA